MSKKLVSAPEQAATREPVQKAETTAENLAQVASQAHIRKGGKMTTKKKAAKPRKATAAQNAGNNPANRSNDTTESPVCQVKSGDFVGIASWEDVKAQLAESLCVSIEQAHAELEETAKRIARTQTERQAKLTSARARGQELDGQLQALGHELSQAMAIARHTLSGEALNEAVGQINLAHAAESEKLEGILDTAEMALAGLEAADEAARADGEIEFQLLQEHLAELEELGPELADQVRLKRSAEENAHRAIRAAREGEIDEAEQALDLAVAGEASAELVARAEATLAEAKHRAEVRGLIARVQAIDPGARKALDDLATLAREGNEKGITANVVSFLNRQKNLAEKIARQRGREDGRLWSLARKEAQRWAENGLPEPGAKLEFGPGRIKVFLKAKKGWVLDSVHVYRDGVWQKRTQPARVTVSAVTGRNVVTVK